MHQLTDQQLAELLPFDLLIDALAVAFATTATVPQRQHYDFLPQGHSETSTLLLMPAWDDGRYLGVKVVTVSPENAQRQLPAIHGTYILFSQLDGRPLLQCDARLLTARRTAAASALASLFLSRKDSRTLLMVGTGVLAPHLIRAHASIRPIKRVLVWGRNIEKAARLAVSLNDEEFRCTVVEDLAEAVSQADIISCATLSKDPLIKGEWVRAGQHLDLVGSYRPDMREVDDGVIHKATLFVDTMTACQESGDLVIPIQRKILQVSDIQKNLTQMCQSSPSHFRTDAQEITLFKSVGHALEDLAAAVLALEQLGLGN